MLEQTLGFCKVDNIYPTRAHLVILHAEHKPLQLSAPVRIIPHPTVVDSRFLTSDLLQISTLELRIERHLQHRLIDLIRHFLRNPVDLLQVDPLV